MKAALEASAWREQNERRHSNQPETNDAAQSAVSIQRVSARNDTGAAGSVRNELIAALKKPFYDPEIPSTFTNSVLSIRWMWPTTRSHDR